LGESFGIAYTAHTSSSSSSLFDLAISLLLRGHLHVYDLDPMIYAFLVYRTSRVSCYMSHTWLDQPLLSQEYRSWSDKTHTSLTPPIRYTYVYTIPTNPLPHKQDVYPLPPLSCPFHRHSHSQPSSSQVYFYPYHDHLHYPHLLLVNPKEAYSPLLQMH
jgi:hypothetical protein